MVKLFGTATAAKEGGALGPCDSVPGILCNVGTSEPCDTLDAGGTACARMALAASKR